MNQDNSIELLIKIAVQEELKNFLDSFRQVTPPPLDEFISGEEISKLTGYRISTLAQLRFKKKLPYYKIGKQILYKRTEILAMIDSMKCGTAKDLQSSAKKNQKRKK